MTLEDTLTTEDYDEFGWLREVAHDHGLAFDPPKVRRRFHELSPGRLLSAIQWGEASPRVVLLHGGRQNAHTWDTVLLELAQPALAIDLPGHGRSYRRPDGDHGAIQAAAALAQALPQLAPDAEVLIGMSLGALTAMRLMATARPARKVVLLDATPPVSAEIVDRSRAAERGVADVERLERYDSFEALLHVAAALNPRRPLRALRRETRLNVMRLVDGSWTWRHDAGSRRPTHPENWAQMFGLWDDVAAIDAPTLLVKAQYSRFVSDDSVAEFRRRLPSARVEVVANSGHAIQYDQPRALTALINDFCFPNAEVS